MDNIIEDALEARRTSMEYMKTLAASAEGNNRGLVASTSVTDARSVVITLKLIDPLTLEPIEAAIFTPFGEENPVFNDRGFCRNRRGNDMPDPLFLAMVKEYGMRIRQDMVVSDDLAPLVMLMAQVTNIGWVATY